MSEQVRHQELVLELVLEFSLQAEGSGGKAQTKLDFCHSIWTAAINCRFPFSFRLGF